MIKMSMDFWMVITQGLGALGTVASVACAIYTYRKTQRNASLLDVKKSICQLPAICDDINLLLNESFFSALGDSISDEFKKLYENGQSLEDYSKFLLDDERSHNYKAQAIYSGLRKCDEVSNIKVLIRSAQDSIRTVSLHFPAIGMAFEKLFFYIETAAQRTISSRIFNRAIAAELTDGSENDSFKEAVQDALDTKSAELYFRELAIYFTTIAQNSLMQTVHGQRTIDLSRKMIELSSDVFGGLELSALNRVRHRDLRFFRKIELEKDTHAVEDAMMVFKEYRKFYKEESWERMIESKGRIIENMSKK